MLLKKQTVWLLTMLSLVVVLSVYYITSPEQTGKEIATIDENKTHENNKASGTDEKSETAGEDEGEVVSSAAGDEIFESLRLELEEERSKRKEALRDTLASTDLPADKRSEAFDEMKKIDEVAQKEALLETLIIAMGYEDALVRADGEKVRITVKSDEPSAEKANEIIQMVKNEIDEMQTVAVTFQGEKKESSK